ncbi:MAG: FAD-dependent oxidoreductase [Propionicimonas sp.]
MVESARRIVIVGGVAGGMSCAARARRLDEGAEIVVLDRGEHVSFANCGLPYYVGGEITDPAKLLVQTPASLRAALNLDVRTRHDVVGLDPRARTLTVDTPTGRESLSYDALVLSPGAVAVRPPIAGLESPRVHTLRTVDDALTVESRVNDARRAVVLGGGFIGLEAAEALAGRGLAVTLVELADHVLPPLEPELASLVTAELKRLGIDVRDGVAANAIETGPAQDVVVLADGSRIEADLIVLSVGVRPDTAVFERAGVACERGAIVTDDHGRTNLPGVWAVGDAVVSVDAITGLRRPVALAGPANRAGRQVAEDILRPQTATPIPQPLGTAIVRVGELTAALTGASRATLLAQGIDHRTVHLHPNQHAGYFPGAAQLHLVIHFRTTDGLLLGAQAVGREGVDKRIDVLATALRYQRQHRRPGGSRPGLLPALRQRQGSGEPGRDDRPEPARRHPRPLVPVGGGGGDGVGAGAGRPQPRRVRHRAPAGRAQHPAHRTAVPDRRGHRRGSGPSGAGDVRLRDAFLSRPPDAGRPRSRFRQPVRRHAHAARLSW